MAGGLIGAAIASGLGQGLSQAAGTGMQLMSASYLQDKRMEAENARLAILEKYAAQREQRGYTHQEEMLGKQQDFARGMKQEEFGQSQLAKDLDVQRTQRVAKEERERLRSPEEIAADAEAERLKTEAGAPTRAYKRNEELTADIEKERIKTDLLGNDPTYLASVKRLKDAQMSDGDKAEAAIKVLQLQQSKDGQRLQAEYVKAVESGDPAKVASAKKSWQAFSEKPWEDDKLTAKMASDGLREAGNEIVRLSSQMKDTMPGSPEAAALQRRLQTAQDSHDAYDTILKTRLGVQPPATKKGGPDFANFKDPLKLDTPTAKGPTPSTPAGTPASPTLDETPPDDWRSATRQSFSNPEGQAAKAFPQSTPLSPADKTAPGNASQLAGYLAEKGDDIAAIPPGVNPTDASSYVTAKREEAQQRAAMNPKAPTGMVTKPGEPEPVTKEPIADVNSPARDNPYEAEIQAASAKYGVPANLIRAVVKHESNFNPSAVSKVGAQGLMQLMPATAKEQGANDPMDPDQNIDAGTKYLAYLLKKYNGDEEKALAAYNFGLGNVDKGLKWPKETQRYVAAVRRDAETDSGPSARTVAASPDKPDYLDAINALPEKQRQYVHSQLDAALQALNAGEIDEETFKQRVMATWVAVPEDDPTKWAATGRALANGMIAEVSAAKGRR